MTIVSNAPEPMRLHRPELQAIYDRLPIDVHARQINSAAAFAFDIDRALFDDAGFNFHYGGSRTLATQARHVVSDDPKACLALFGLLNDKGALHAHHIAFEARMKLLHLGVAFVAEDEVVVLTVGNDEHTALVFQI